MYQLSAEGRVPGGGLIFDTAGNLYGTASSGGPFNGGVVFELSPQNGQWVYTIIHSFDFSDGAGPVAGLVFDGAGNLYGTTALGGQNGMGTIFQLTPDIGGWIETVLHHFDGSDGNKPEAPLVVDSGGNLYGTTYAGGGGCLGSGCGTAFELSPKRGRAVERAALWVQG